MKNKTIFEKILCGEIPCKPIYEDEHTFAFKDTQPVAPIHILIIPKQKLVNVNDMNESFISQGGHILLAAKTIAQQLNLREQGYRLVFNNGEGAGQSVFYMHCHLLSGRDFTWPPG